MPDPIAVTLIGSTGLTGSATLRTLLSSSTQPFHIKTFTRKALAGPEFEPKGQHQQSGGNCTHLNRAFGDLFDAVKEQLAEKGDVYVSCLGTTRAQAGGFEQQKKIDLDLNRDLAKKAREDGARIVRPTLSPEL